MAQKPAKGIGVSVDQDALMTEKEVADLLGTGVWYVRNRRADNSLPYIRLSRRTLRFKKSDVLRFVDRLRV